MPALPKMLRIGAAIGSANKAILQGVTHEEVYRRVCEGMIAWAISTAIFLKDVDGTLRFEAGAGVDIETIRHLHIALEATPAQPCFVAKVIADGRPYLIEDFPASADSSWWLERGIGLHAGIAGAAPIFREGVTAGIFLYFLEEPSMLATEVAGYIDEVVHGLSFTLDRLQHEHEKDRIRRMVSALSESNEAILRAETREKLYQLVCEAAVQGGRFTGTAIALAEPEKARLKFLASTGQLAEQLTLRNKENRTVSTDPASADSAAMTVTAYRTGMPSITNDYLGDPRLAVYHKLTIPSGTRSGAALPLFSRGETVGAFLCTSSEVNYFTPEFMELLRRLAANVSVALDNFDRAEEKERAEERIRYLATHDSLTNLPNRNLLSQLLNFSIRTAERYQRKCALLFIDLDRFKIINDSLGHAAGDELLVEMARRLRSHVRSSDVVARFGGDEFIVLINEITETSHAGNMARRLLLELGRPLTLAGQECRVTASIGISMYPDDGEDEHTLMKNADSAMYRAKTEGNNDVRLFSSEIRSQTVNRLRMEVGLRYALEREELCLHYQPKYDVSTGQIAGVEALLRWAHPVLGQLSPVEFIPIAEESGLIVPIGSWVLHEACRQNMEWQHAGLKPVSVAVNVSPRQFSDENFLHEIDSALAISGMNRNHLQIEITESMVMLNTERAIQVLDAIQVRGVRLAIDDFGTGYSSMSMLKRIPIDTIKIDRSFVHDLPHKVKDQAIIQAIINMGKVLGLTIVAEGVETKEQDDFLRENACDEIQGFLYSKPMPPEELAAQLRRADLALNAPSDPTLV